MRYEAWLVDLDGTLYVAQPVRLLMGLELMLFGPRALRHLRAFRHQHEALRHEGFRGPPSPFEEQLQRAAQQLRCPREELRSLVEQWMMERPSRWLWHFRRRALLEQLQEYRSSGGKLALVSDYPAQRKLAALRAKDLFHCVIANGESGGPDRLKPDPSGYLSAARALEIPPERCLVIGDREDADGRAAAAAGMAFRRVG